MGILIDFHIVKEKKMKTKTIQKSMHTSCVFTTVSYSKRIDYVRALPVAFDYVILNEL